MTRPGLLPIPCPSWGYYVDPQDGSGWVGGTHPGMDEDGLRMGSGWVLSAGQNPSPTWGFVDFNPSSNPSSDQDPQPILEPILRWVARDGSQDGFGTGCAAGGGAR